jgi:hypothetical protein
VKSPLKPSSFLFYLFFVLLFSIQVVPRFWWDSLTNDEPSDITNGYYYLTRGDVVTPHNHPPLAGALNAIPLLFMNLKTNSYSGDVIDRGHLFIFNWNLDQLESITVWSRSVSWVLGCVLGFLLFWMTRKDRVLAAAVLFLWALNPTLGALSGLAKTDIAPALFFFLAVLLFRQSQDQDTPKFFTATGVAAAMAVTSKFYCLVLIPVFLALEFFEPDKSFALDKWRLKDFRPLGRKWLWGAAGFFGWVFLLYLPATLLLPSHREPFAYFIGKFKEDIVFSRNPFPVYFLGTSGLESHWYYLPAAFVLKEPLSFLLALILGLGLAFRKKIIIPPWQWLPPLFFSLAVLPTLNLGERYLLPTFPFLFMVAGGGAAWMWSKTGRKVSANWRLAVTALALWQSASVALNFPHAISYFNELVAPEKKMRFLADSNLDWGQDLKRLADTAKERKWHKVRLAYMGGVDPKVYGLDWEPWRKSDLSGPQPGMVYAVNASFFQLAPTAYPPTRMIAMSWINENPASGKIADSWYYFEIPGEPRPAEKDTPLVSAPFLQYRGYTSYGAIPPNQPLINIGRSR